MGCLLCINSSVFKRFYRWCFHSVWKDLHGKCVKDPGLQSVFSDSTVIRAHAYAAGAAGSTNPAEGLGRSVGRYITKLHVITDGLGNLIDFVLTQGQASDIGQGQRLVELTPTGIQAFMADKKYNYN